jgi:hypothetical protein
VTGVPANKRRKLGSSHMGLTSLGLEINIRRVNEKTPLIRGQSDFRSDFCRKTKEKMDSEVECDSPRDAIDLRSHEEFVRTVDLSTLLGSFGKSAKKMLPGKYVVQITSRQADSTLVSNELTIVVRPKRP